MSAKLVIAAALTGALAASPAFAQDAQLGIPGPAAPEAADQTLGVALLGAVILATGIAQKEYSAGVVGSSRTGTGEYQVQFNRSLRGCTPMATSVTNDRTVGITGPTGPDADTWLLSVKDLTGTFVDSAVSLINICTR